MPNWLVRSLGAVVARGIVTGATLTATALIPSAVLAQNRPSEASVHFYVESFRTDILSLTTQIENLECVNPSTYWDWVGRIDGIESQLGYNESLSPELKKPFYVRIDRMREILKRVHHCPGTEWTVTRQETFWTDYLGVDIVKTTGSITTTERNADTGEITNVFNERKDPLGGGIVAGMNFTGGNGLQYGPFVSLDFPNIAIKHTFPGGSYLGARSNVEGTLGAKFGPTFSSAWLYGIAGISVLNEKLTVNFLPASSSTTATVPGATIGVGASFQPAFLQGFGRPVALFAEYQHTWWQDAKYITPAASPFFNYTFARSDDTFKVGFLVSLDPPPRAPAVKLITK